MKGKNLQVVVVVFFFLLLLLLSLLLLLVLVLVVGGVDRRIASIFCGSFRDDFCALSAS